MDKKEDGGPAFPRVERDGFSVVIYEGMSLRDYFAAVALTGLVSKGVGYPTAAESAYGYADSMLEVRKEK